MMRHCANRAARVTDGGTSEAPGTRLDEGNR